MVIGSSQLQWSDLWFVLQGALNTLLVSMLAGVAGTCLGAVLGWAAQSSVIAKYAATPIIDVVRSVPLIIQFILTGSFLSLMGYPVHPFLLGTLVLSIYMAVLTSELARSGLSAVPIQLIKSARSLGMTGLQELLHISAPLAVRTAIPGWIGLVLGLVKDSSLLGVVGYVELLRSVQILDTRTHKTLLLLFGVGLAYFALCYPISVWSRRLERQLIR